MNSEQWTANLLTRYDAARRALAEAHSVDEVKDIRDKAVALAVYATQAKDRELIEHATEIRLRAERRSGELLREMAERGERRDHAQRSRATTSEPLPPRLSDLGITKTQSSNWQRLADMEPPAFEARVERSKRKAANALDGAGRRTRQEMRADDERRVRSLIPRPGKYRTLIIDPPWDYEWLSVAGRATPGYATMTHDQLLALDVGQWAESDCHLYLWVTDNFLTRGCELMARWGFQHRTVLTWRKLSKTGKPWWGLGAYFRNATEHVLFGVRGSLRTRADDISTFFEAPIGEHSEKPEIFYDIVRRASYLPAGEAFQRKARDGFVNLYAETAADDLDIPAYLRRAAE